MRFENQFNVPLTKVTNDNNETNKTTEFSYLYWKSGLAIPCYSKLFWYTYTLFLKYKVLRFFKKNPDQIFGRICGLKS